MSDEPQRPYYDKDAVARRRAAERALVVAPEQIQRENKVTLVYNWITKQFEAYLGQKKTQ